MATTLVAGTGAGVEDGLPGGTGGGTSGFESGCEWKRGGGADGVDEGVSVLRSEGRINPITKIIFRSNKQFYNFL